MLKLHGYFRDGAVLQRGKRVLVKGYAKGHVVCLLEGGTIKFETTAEAKDGRFEAEFPAVTDTQSKFRLKVCNEEESVSVTVKFGDVYLMAGQSNMSYALSAVEDSEEWDARAQRADIAVLDLREPPEAVPEEVFRPVEPQADFVREYAWRKGTSFSDVSALSVMTAVLLSEREDVPIGIVHTAMGGLSAETYVRRETAEADTKLIAYLKELGRYCTPEEYNHCGGRNFTQIGGVWNEKIAPLQGISFAGIVWYLGESSAYDFRCAKAFKVLMHMVLKDFRSVFGKIPFAAVQIAPEYYPYGDRFGYLYVNEVLASLESDAVTVVPVYDIEPRWLKTDGELYYHPIHTVNKAPVAQRIADALSGACRHFPRIGQVDFMDGAAVCRIGGGTLKKRNYQGFTLAGEDGKYYPAQAATISATELKVWSEEVKRPRALTYAFLQYQDFCDVKTTDGLPVLPYRTRFERVTDKYCMIPAYCVAGAKEVYENCFGWNVGTCRKVPVWTKGLIYDAGAVKINVTRGGIQIESKPEPSKYFLFGISPNICLSGHKNHIGDYKFWNFALSADSDAEFFGVVVRSASGEVFRPDLYSGAEKMTSVSLNREARTFGVYWETGIRGDGAPVAFSRKDRESFVQAEFVFRSKNPVKVFLQDLSLSDKNKSEKVEMVEKQALRADIVLPKF